MAFVLTIKTDFGEIKTKVESVPRTLNAYLAESVNRAGGQMSNVAEFLIASNTGVPLRAVKAGLDRYSATSILPTFTLKSDQTKFPYVRWKTQRDEKVCPICAPRDGLLYQLSEVRYLFPAHPNCRCQLDPVDLGGELVSVAKDVLPDALSTVANDVLQLFQREW